MKLTGITIFTMTIPIRRTDLLRSSRFGFSCNRCLHCCASKKIQVNPYEIARIADRLGIPTTEFIKRFTVENGSFLKFTDRESCIFLGSEGCTVHSDRPLVCRLYPLARHVDHKGEEWFSELEPEVSCKGEYLSVGTIAGYLAEQNAFSYIQAANIYLNLLWELMSALENRQQNEAEPCPIEEEITPENWMDMDEAVKSFCLRHGMDVPRTKNEKMRLHIEALRKWIKET